MKREKEYILPIAVSVLMSLPMIFFRSNAASTTATVTATVSPESISVSVSDHIIAYDAVPLSSAKSTIDLSDTQSATNEGNVEADFNIQGQNSAAWTLMPNSGPNQYAHKFCTSSCSTPPTNYLPSSTAYNTLITSVDAGSATNFDLMLVTPTTTSSYSAQNVDVIIQAIKHTP